MKFTQDKKFALIAEFYSTISDAEIPFRVLLGENKSDVAMVVIKKFLIFLCAKLKITTPHARYDEPIFEKKYCIEGIFESLDQLLEFNPILYEISIRFHGNRRKLEFNGASFHIQRCYPSTAFEVEICEIYDSWDRGETLSVKKFDHIILKKDERELMFYAHTDPTNPYEKYVLTDEIMAKYF